MNLEAPKTVKVSVEFEMAYIIDETDGDAQYCGWATDFPGVVVQASTLDVLIEEFKIGANVIARYLVDTNANNIEL